MSVQVLVIDDESVTRRVVMYALKSLDIEVIGAADGIQALELAKTHSLALAIVDINLPDMDGFEIIRHLKSMPSIQHIPIILFTARNQPGDEIAALEAGAAGFLYKPFSTQELRDMVKRHLGQQ